MPQPDRTAGPVASTSKSRGWRSRLAALSPLELHRYFWRFKLTPMGRWWPPVVLLAALGSVSLELPIHLLFLAMLAFLGVGELLGFVCRPRLDASTPPLRTTCTGATITVPVLLTNRGWKPAFDIHAGWFGLPEPLRQLHGHLAISVLPPGASAVLPVTLTASRRGVYALPPLIVHTTFPFNLLRFEVGRTRGDRLVVHPRRSVLNALDLPLTHRYQPRGAAHTGGVGASPEYVGNREYTPGEPAVRLDVRAWARTGKLVVREFQEEYFCRVALVLDTHVPRGWRRNAAGERALEAAVNLTASLADALQQAEHLIDVFASGPALYVYRQDAPATSFDSVLEILSGVESSPDNPIEQLSPAVADELESLSTVLCVFLDWDNARWELRQRALDAGCTCRVVVVRDGPTTRPLPDEPGVLQLGVDDVLQGRLDALGAP